MQLSKDKLSVKYKKNDEGLQAITLDNDLHSTNIIDSRYYHDDNYVTQVIEPTVPFLNPVRFNVDYYPNFIGKNIEIDLQ